MSAVVVYESMFGCTRTLALEIRDGLRGAGMPAEAFDVRDVLSRDDLVARADLLVIGAPTHARGLPTERTREVARSRGALAPAAVGVHEWLDAVPGLAGRRTAVFDTHVAGRFAGSAAHRLERLARRRDARLVTAAFGFEVEQDAAGRATLTAGCEAAARTWGGTLASLVLPRRPDPVQP